ncbi:hypothetical protein M433DRAFT_9266 [Acidomyces richmondensis BFW]|nr:hypothetical protein M433DRAFT_9266 [Acidomyces richmondensis BFW]
MYLTWSGISTADIQISPGQTLYINRSVTALDRLDRNRSKVISDRRTPRKSFASAVSTSSSAFEEARLLELQLLRRSILALVAVGKELVRIAGGNAEAIDSILGPDAPNVEEAP